MCMCMLSGATNQTPDIMRLPMKGDVVLVTEFRRNGRVVVSVAVVAMVVVAAVA